MQLRNIEVAGFRSLASKVVINDLARINVFVGKNNAGKTNVIEILRLLNGLIFGNQYRAPLDFLTKGQETMSLSLKFSLDDNERKQMIGRLFKDGIVQANDVTASKFLTTVTHSLDVAPHGIVEETVSANNLIEGEAIVWGLFKRDNQVEVRGCDLSEYCRNLQKVENLSVGLTPRIGAGGPAIWNSLWDQGVKAVDVLPAMLRDLYSKIDWTPPIRQSQIQMPPVEAKRLDASASNLPQVWNTIVSDDPRELVKIGEDIERIVDISSISAPVRGNQTAPALKEEAGMSFNLTNTSSGVHQAAILATKIRTCPPGGILLIEEPELHLHPGAQRGLLEIIQRHSEDLQFFLTTHSTIFTELESNSSVYLVSKKGMQSTIKLISEPDELKSVKSELGHRNVDLYSYDKIVFIEGDSEEVALPIIAKNLGFNLRRNGIFLQNLKGSSKAKKLGQFLEYLRIADVEPFVVADGNKEVKEKLAEWKRPGYCLKETIVSGRRSLRICSLCL